MTYKLESDGWHYEARFSLGVAAWRCFTGGKLTTRNVKAAAIAAKLVQERTLSGRRYPSLKAAQRDLGNLARLCPESLKPSTGGSHVC